MPAPQNRKKNTLLYTPVITPVQCPPELLNLYLSIYLLTLTVCYAPVCLSVCTPACLSNVHPICHICVSTYLPHLCLYIRLSVYTPTCLPSCTTIVHMYVSTSYDYLSVRRSVDRSVERDRGLGHLCEGTECDLEPWEEPLLSLYRPRFEVAASLPRSPFPLLLRRRRPPPLSPRSFLSRLPSRREDERCRPLKTQKQ